MIFYVSVLQKKGIDFSQGTKPDILMGFTIRIVFFFCSIKK